MAATATGTKKTPARKTTRAPHMAPAAPKAPAPFEPLRLSSAEGEPPEMVDLFEIDGTMYQVPRRPSASISLKYLDAVEQLGQGAANYWVLREMLGKEGYEALSNCKSLADEHVTWIVETVQGLVLGTVEAPKG